MSDGSPATVGGSNKIPILFGCIVALLGANIYLYTQLEGVKNEFSDFRKNVQNEFASVKESSSVSIQTARRNLTSLRDELETARRQASMAAGQAKAEAQRHAEELATKLSVEQSKFEKAQQAMKTELTQVGEAATTANTKLGEVSTEVGTVKTEVAATKGELEKTIADLKRARGDIDNQSSLIATNGKELGALRALGERNYTEFTITKSKEPKKLGDVTVLLKKADPKRNKFTIELVADDKSTEKKDRNINEPLQFYVAKARQPYELVVNEVKKDTIVGYLSTPKVQAARNP
jgi:chromosome segregation ATPase